METQHGEIVMNDSDFLDKAESLLRGVEHSCDRINDASLADIDNQRVGSMVTLIFPNQSQIIINLQKPLHEVWMAAKAGGFHFKHVADQWMDTKGQGEFFNCLSRFASEQAGSSLVFSSHSVSE